MDLADPAVRAGLPNAVAVSAVSLAGPAAGPALATNDVERARRVARLQEVEALFAPIDVDRAAPRSYGIVVAAVAQSGRTNQAASPIS